MIKQSSISRKDAVNLKQQSREPLADISNSGSLELSNKQIKAIAEDPKHVAGDVVYPKKIKRLRRIRKTKLSQASKDARLRWHHYLESIISHAKQQARRVVFISTDETKHDLGASRDGKLTA